MPVLTQTMAQFRSPYEQALAAARERAAAPPPPAMTPEQIANAQWANTRDYQLGLLGQLSGDDTLAGVGGNVLKNALAARQKRVTDRGAYDPLTGEFREHPEVARQRAEQAVRDLEEREAAAAARWEEQRQRAAEAAERAREQREFMAAQRDADRQLRAQMAAQSAETRRLLDPGLRPAKPLPLTVAKGLAENRAALSNIETALDLVERNPDSFGLQNYMPDVLKQRLDPEGVEARAIVANIGSLKIHDRSGAAVTAMEFPRLQPFIPSDRDAPETVRTKLKGLRDELLRMEAETADFFAGLGYEPPPQRGAGAAAAAGAQPPADLPTLSPEEAMKLPPGTRFRGHDGNIYER